MSWFRCHFRSLWLYKSNCRDYLGFIKPVGNRNIRATSPPRVCKQSGNSLLLPSRQIVRWDIAHRRAICENSAPESESRAFLWTLFAPLVLNVCQPFHCSHCFSGIYYSTLKTGSRLQIAIKERPFVWGGIFFSSWSSVGGKKRQHLFCPLGFFWVQKRVLGWTYNHSGWSDVFPTYVINNYLT